MSSSSLSCRRAEFKEQSSTPNWVTSAVGSNIRLSFILADRICASLLRRLFTKILWPGGGQPKGHNCSLKLATVLWPGFDHVRANLLPITDNWHITSCLRPSLTKGWICSQNLTTAIPHCCLGLSFTKGLICSHKLTTCFPHCFLGFSLTKGRICSQKMTTGKSLSCHRPA